VGEVRVRLGDAAVFLGSGSFFLVAAAWMRTNEHWATESDRVGYEERPTRIRYANYLLSRTLNRVETELHVIERQTWLFTGKRLLNPL
jgi:hypothetical protein